MTAAVIARLLWAALALPLAGLFLSISLSTLPLVFQNSPPRLGLIAYVIACPLLPLFWRGSRVAPIVVVAGAALIFQFVAVGIINFWF
jgi:hypothetical protein